MHDHAPLPRWFLAVFTAVMLALAAELFWFVPQQADLRFQLDDLTLSLDTSRQREAKQQYEYDQVVEQLPLTQAELSALLPLTQDAQAREAALRTQRKELRARQSELDTQLNEAAASATDLQAQLDTLQAEVHALQQQASILRQESDALLEQQNDLQAQADALCQQLQP